MHQLIRRVLLHVSDDEEVGGTCWTFGCAGVSWESADGVVLGAGGCWELRVARVLRGDHVLLLLLHHCVQLVVLVVLLNEGLLLVPLVVLKLLLTLLGGVRHILTHTNSGCTHLVVVAEINFHSLLLVCKLGVAIWRHSQYVYLLIQIRILIEMII